MNKKIKQDKRIESDRCEHGEISRYVYVWGKSVPKKKTSAKATKPYLCVQK